MPTVCHFEIPADDPQRAKKFYEDLFGWEIKHYPDMDYYGIMTGPEGKALNGGMMKRQAPEQTPVNYIDVDSVESYAKKVQDLGGRIVMEKTPVPGMGWFIICLDSENNAFGLWEGDEKAA
ncbi:glyoxalase [candidate division LCP-89 bacterium B3_LCP]|uniref:Glyoxalase n=1 Tax=candidate division LCP-89 bacterium B3_LCP TaxID=2012998 RepID=A0A532UNX4_UNCL8|nr:MAG: glyoxalase [candidate division LCP-89 bacterium B3_LCP]